MNPRAFNRMMERFRHHGTSHLEQVFDIPSSKVLSTLTKLINLQITETSQLGVLEFTFKYMELSTLQYQGWKLMDMCEDMERLVYSYLKDVLVLKFQIDFSNRFPFRAPKVTITFCSNPRYDIYTVTEQFNCDTFHDWSPALGIDLTTLCFLNRVLEAIKYV
jgi:hypothetical protein